MNKILSLLFVVCLACVSCKESTTPTYDFSAKVLYQGIDCGNVYLILLENKGGDTSINDDVYYADNLPAELKVEDLKIVLNCRLPQAGEIPVCTALGPAYPHIYVVEAKVAE